MKNRHVVNGSCTIDNRDIQCMNVRHDIVHIHIGHIIIIL